jgi:hypothetical protein
LHAAARSAATRDAAGVMRAMKGQVHAERQMQMDRACQK